MNKLIVAFGVIFVLAALAACRSNVSTSHLNEDMLSGITRGIWDEDVYINEYLGFSFALPEQWMAAGDNEMAALAGISAEILSNLGQELSDDFWEIAGITMLWDMWVLDLITGTSVQIIYEVLRYPKSMMSEIQFIETIVEQAAQTTLEMKTSIIPIPTIIGNYAWYSYTNEIAVWGNFENMRHFINIRDGIVRHIIVNYLPDIAPLEGTLRLFSGAE